MPSVANERGKVFRDSIHGLIPIEEEDSIILEIIDTPEFQRLRRVRQLGVSSFTYPGAEHTRFAHSLGVYNFACKIMNRLLERHGESTDAGRALKQNMTNVKIACLLHDVGHGPFSHASEHIFDSKNAHEQKSREIITSSESKINEILMRRLSASAVKDIAGLLEKHEFPFLHDIVSSQLDADRMDYLLRDSHHSGTRYGHYDSEWLTHSFCLGHEANPNLQRSTTTLRLCLDTKRGPHAAVQLILARLHMNLQVYFHGNTRNMEAHLSCLFHQAANLATNVGLPPLTHPSIIAFFEGKGKTNHEAFLLLDDSTMWAHFSYWSTLKNDSNSQFKALAQWSRALLYREKMLTEWLMPSNWASPQVVELLKQDLAKAGGIEHVDWIIDEGKVTPYKAPLLKNMEEDSEAYFEEISKSAILLSNGALNEPSSPLQHSSEILAGLGGQKYPLVRLYYSADVEEGVQKIIAKYSGNAN